MSIFFDEHNAHISDVNLALINQDATVTAVDLRPGHDATKLLYRVFLGQQATFFRREVVSIGGER